MPYSVTPAHGAKVQLGSTASTPVYTDLNGVFNGPNGPELSPIIVEARHHGTAQIWKRATGVQVGPVTFDVHYDSSDTNHAALVTAASTKAVRKFKILFNDNGSEIATFDAYVKTSHKADLAGTNVLSVQLDIYGDVVFST